MIAEILEVEGEHLTLWHSCHAKIEPGPVVLAIHVRCRITGHPNVKEALLVSSRGLGHVTAAKLAAEHDL